VVPGRTVLVEATAGNTGIALAAAAAGRYRLVMTMSTKMGPEKEALLRAWGAEVVRCPYEVPPESPHSFLNTARAIADDHPDAYYVDQFNNPWNTEAHELTTGPEILAQTRGQIGAFVAGVGTGGTFTGVGRHLRSQGCRATMVMADPVGSILSDAIAGRPSMATPYRLEGIGGDFVPPLLDTLLVDRAVTVSDQEAVSACLRLQEEEGLFVGGSAGCAVAAALRVCEELEGPPTNVVVLLPDGGARYLSTIFDAKWRRSMLAMGTGRAE
jgi:cystathionine beta-synthase